MQNTLLIVDGNNLLFQMFYGIPTKIYNKRGRTIHATLGFIAAVQKMVKTFGVNRLIVVFDEDGSEERKQTLSDYKANRARDWDSLPPDEIPFLEEEYIFACLEYLGVQIFPSKGMEADDCIATIALRERQNGKVYISSFDSDFFQLIDDRISVIRYRGAQTKVYTKESFFNEFSFFPERYALYKALTGDAADNVDGVPSIGKKRAAEIVRVCQDFASLYQSQMEFLPCKARENVRSSFPLIERNLSLIALCEKEIGEYSLTFDEEKSRLTHSQILSACHVFE